MRSLIITQFASLRPEDAVGGAFRRLRLFANAVARISSEVEFLCVVRDEDIAVHADSKALNEAQLAYWGFPARMILVPMGDRRETFWRHYGAGIRSIAEQPDFYAFAGPAQAQAVGEHLDRQPDLVLVCHLPTMAALLRSGRRPRNLFFDLDDIEHKFRIRSALAPPLWPGKFAYCAHVPAIWAAERKAAALSRIMFVCSDADRRHLRRIGFGQNIAVIPNALRLPDAIPGVVEDRTLLFIGTYQYRPNRDAAERLISRIWPLIRARAPEARLLVAGKSPDAIPSFAGAPAGVTFTGFVPDLDRLYAQSRLVVCPLTVGGGTRVKLLEAASYARPMVSTRIGAEGLDFVDGQEILLRDGDAAFAEICVRLLHEDGLCATLGTAARAKMAAIYDAEKIQERIADLMLAKMIP